MLQTLIRLFLVLLLETYRDTDCMPPATACSSNGREQQNLVGRRQACSHLYLLTSMGASKCEGMFVSCAVVERALS